MIVEGVEPIRPELPERLEPGIERSQLAGLQAIEPPLAFRPHLDQAGLAQLPEVLGRPRLAEAGSRHQVTGRPFPASQKL